MKKLLTTGVLAMLLGTGILSSCQTDTTDRNHYDARANGTPGVKTQGEKDDLSPRIDLPEDTTAATSAADTTVAE